MAAGNKIGFSVCGIADEKLRSPDCTALILEIPEGEKIEELLAGVKYDELGKTNSSGEIAIGELTFELGEALEKWTAPLEEIFPAKASNSKSQIGDASANTVLCDNRSDGVPGVKTTKPGVLIPVFPGTNNEGDLKRAFEKAGGDVRLHIIRNLTPKMYEESVSAFVGLMKDSRILMVAGGLGTVLWDERIREEISGLLEKRDGLILGIGEGFSTLLRLGLLPHGRFGVEGACPVMTDNISGKHISRIVRTKVASVKSPWFSQAAAGEVFTAVYSTGHGRFYADEKQIAEMAANGQIASQFVCFDGNASMDAEFNPGLSAAAIEAVTSPDGRILGKITHPERVGENLYKNVPGNYEQKIFESGVEYYK
jgi:phosphoribosylformylglycinamidine synthase